VLFINVVSPPSLPPPPNPPCFSPHPCGGTFVCCCVRDDFPYFLCSPHLPVRRGHRLQTPFCKRTLSIKSIPVQSCPSPPLHLKVYPPIQPAVYCPTPITKSTHPTRLLSRPPSCFETFPFLSQRSPPRVGVRNEAKCKIGKAPLIPGLVVTPSSFTLHDSSATHQAIFYHAACAFPP